MPRKVVLIATPTSSEVKRQLTEWDALPKYVAQESSLDKLFSTFGTNTTLEDVLIKTSCLNDFYSTKCFLSV